MAFAGKSFVVKVSVTAGGAGSYTAVDEIGSCKMAWKGGSGDISDFGSTWKSYLQTLKDATYSLEGTWDSADTNGQVAIQSAFLNDIELWVQYLPNGTAGWKQQVICTGFDLSEEVDGVCKVSITLQGTGAAPATV